MNDSEQIMWEMKNTLKEMEALNKQSGKEIKVMLPQLLKALDMIGDRPLSSLKKPE